MADLRNPSASPAAFSTSLIASMVCDFRAWGELFYTSGQWSGTAQDRSSGVAVPTQLFLKGLSRLVFLWEHLNEKHVAHLVFIT